MNLFHINLDNEIAKIGNIPIFKYINPNIPSPKFLFATNLKY